MIDPLFPELERGGLADESGGIPGGFLDTTRVLVPAVVNVDEEEVRWQLTEPGATVDLRGEAPAGMLDQFLRAGSAEQLGRFATRYGALEICEDHELPSTHLAGIATGNGFFNVNRRIGAREECAARWDGPWRVEPRERWDYFRLQARAILDIASRMSDTKTMSLDDCRTLYVDHLPPTERLAQLFEVASENPGASRALLANVVNEWLHLGGIHPILSVEGGSLSIRVRGKTFGLLALQLAVTVGRAGHLAFCSGCGEGYTPKRRPKRGQRNYCLECRRNRIDGRDRAERYRERRKSERSERSERTR